MKLVDWVTETFGFYSDTDDDEVDRDFAQERNVSDSKSTNAFASQSRFAPKSVARAVPSAVREGTQFSAKSDNKSVDKENRTVSMPVGQKQVKVVVIEPSSFDDSQKVADFLRNNQPVIVNYTSTDKIVAKRMTDFISGTIYALGGNIKNIGNHILVCAPKNVDINDDNNNYEERGGQPWKR